MAGSDVAVLNIFPGASLHEVLGLVLLDANPLADIRNTTRISAVLLRGKAYQKPGLAALRARVRSMPDIRVNDWRK